MRKFFLPLFLSCCLSAGFAQAPTTFLLDGNRLTVLRSASLQKNSSVSLLVASLRQKADVLLAMQPVSVVDKGFTPPSGSKHDYMSQAPYFWYDSSKPNGLPYLRRDGMRNPEINKIEDHRHLDELENAVYLLSLAFYFTGEQKYAEKANTLLRYWFLDDNTRMNPNQHYGQGIPGITEGRGIGLIETRSLIDIADAIQLLHASQAMRQKDYAALVQWYRQFLDWMLTSKNGKEERAAKNNHGTWYNAQVVAYALFTGAYERAKQLAEESKRRIDSQITAEGKMPLELERTTALGYSTFNLVAWCRLAVLAQKAGVDLWNYTNTKGAGIRKAIDWLTPFVIGDTAWPYQQINPYNKAEMYEVLLYAARNYKQPSYDQAAIKTGEKGKDVLLDAMLGAIP